MRDKLAAAAREKMTQVTLHTKDKDLQAARKLKAAMFISMLKSKDKSKQTTIGRYTEHQYHESLVVVCDTSFLISGVSDGTVIKAIYHYLINMRICVDLFPVILH